MDNLHVLVIGGGYSGLSAADILANDGFRVTLIEKNTQLGGIASGFSTIQPQMRELVAHTNSRTLIDVHYNTQPIRIRGQAGNFEVTVESTKGLSIIQCTSIVFATGCTMTFPDVFQSSPHLFLLSDMDRIRDVLLTNPSVTPNRMAFVTCYGPQHRSFFMEQVLKYSLYLRLNLGIEIDIITDMVRFNHAWMPLEYEECRRAGVRFFRTRLPEFINEDTSLKLRIHDEAIAFDQHGQSIDLSYRLVVIDPVFRSNSMKTLFWSPQEPPQDPDGYYGRLNHHYSSVETGRNGIYIIGAATGMKSTARCLEDVSNLLNVIKRKVTVRDTPHVDEQKCVACLTCARLCPHGAITVSTTSHIDPAGCSACGICAAECPACAISMPPSIHQVCSKVVQGRVLVYCCQGSGKDSIQNWLAMNPSFNPIEIHHLECGGELSTKTILDHFIQGVSLIILLICQDGNCRHINGNNRLAKRIKQLRNMLSQVGLSPDRIVVIRTASNEVPILPIQQMHESLNMQ